MTGRALVAMSGGVDSSVAAALMLEAGWDVIGVTLKQWEEADGSLPTTGCCTVADAEDARRVSAQLGMPHYVLDYVDRFRDEVVPRFGADYTAGRTPNPCIECNRRVRFDALLARTADLGCDVLVTGHHARVRRRGARYRLLTAVDDSKDQSYVLHMLGQAQLASIRLPVGEMTKEAVRERAATLGLRTAGKADSQDLCFVGAEGYRSFLRRHFPDAARPGPIVDHDGTVLGRHEGTVDFTVGQRKGIGVAVGEPRYVVAVQPGTSTVAVGRKEDLRVDGCRVEDVSFVAGEPPSEERIEVKVRYRSRPVPARFEADPPDWAVWFEQPMGGVAPGQAAVFYRGGEVLGGGTIAESLRR